MLDVIKKHWPLAVALIVLWTTLAVCVGMAVAQNHGNFIYALDDGYIHMAIGKNLAQYGVWGITKYGFSSSFSSLLWPVLLSSVYFLFGVNEFSPLVLNIIFAMLICLVTYISLRKNKCLASINFLVLTAIIFFTPMVLLVLTGMEHVLHALITILFACISVKILVNENPATKTDFSLLLISALLLATVRYEGLFLLFVVICFFVARKRFLQALSLVLAGAVPIIVYGVISMSKGWYFLPNSLLLNCISADFFSLKGILTSFGYSVYLQIAQAPYIMAIMLVALFFFNFLYTKRGTIWKSDTLMLLILFLTSYLHMQFVGTHWFTRYEAYLVAFGLFVLGKSISEYLGQDFQFKFSKKSVPQVLILVFLFLLSGFSQRGVASLIRLPQSMTNIYQQQYQMGLFLQKFYQGQTVVASDIGAINYLAEIECLDLWGLGSIGVAEARLRGRYDSQYIGEASKAANAKIAILDNARFVGRVSLPGEWVKVGQWRILNNWVNSDDTISFYAVDTSEENNLIANLRAFASILPKEIIQDGKYMQ